MCRRMLESFLKTKGSDTEIFVYVDGEDSTAAQYRAILKDLGIKYEFGPHKYLCQVDNYAATIAFPGLEYYHEVNDDHIFVEEGWDSTMQNLIRHNNNWGIVSGEGNWHLPTATMISGNIIRALRYWFPTEFEHHSCDLFTKDIGSECGLLLYPNKTLIEHMHPAWGKGANDENYKWVYSKEQADIGTMAYQKWCAMEKAEDILKLKKAMLKG